MNRVPTLSNTSLNKSQHSSHQRKAKAEGSSRTYYCETEPSEAKPTSQQLKQVIEQSKRVSDVKAPFSSEDFEKVVEFTESEEEDLG